MISKILETLFLRELRALRREIEAYADEQQLWVTNGGITNSAGNLALHLCGNLQHFIGAQLGGSGYVRHPDLEFSRRAVPRAEILAEIDAASSAVDNAFDSISESDLEKSYPEELAKTTVPT